MNLHFKKLGNSTGLIFPASFLREHALREGLEVTVDAQPDGSFVLRPKAARRRYSAAELNAQCDMSAPLPDDLQAWEQAPAVGSELP